MINNYNNNNNDDPGSNNQLFVSKLNRLRRTSQPQIEPTAQG